MGGKVMTLCEPASTTVHVRNKQLIHQLYGVNGVLKF